MSTIITRNSATSGSTPSSLVQGELAINVTDNRLFFGSGSGNVVKEFGVTASYAIQALSSSFASTASYVTGTVTSPGSDTQVIFNNGGVLGANSGFVYSGSNVGIGTSSPAYKLSVAGKLSLVDGVDSIFIGLDAGKNDDGTSNSNIAIGTSASQNNTTGANNIAIGTNTLFSSNASNNTAIGTNTLRFNTSGTPNTAVGSFSQVSSSTGTFNTSLGTNTLFNNTVGSFHTALGASVLFSLLTGNSNNGIGSGALFSLITGSENNALGRNAGRYFGTGTSALTEASASIFIGFNSRANAVGETNQIVIGNEALGLGSNTVVLGNDNIVTTALKGNVGIGKINPSTKLDINGDATITGSLIVTNGITGSLLGTSSYAINTLSASYAATASYAPLYLPLTGGTISGNINVLGTASIAFLNVTYESASIIYSSGSNQFGDASNDVQTLWGTVDVKTGPVLITGSQYISGSIYLHNTPDSIYFSGSGAASRLVWNDTDGTLDLGLKGGNVTLQIGQENVIRVVNKSGGNLLESDFQVVRVRSVAEGGAQGQRLAVVLAQADNDADSATTLGVVTENILNNQEGFITIFGTVRGIDTTGAKSYGGLETWVDGDMLYLSPFYPGYLTNVKPIAPQHLVIVGYVEYAHAINGKIFVKIDNGWELGELHDVLDTTTTSSYGDLLVKSGSVWTNSKQLTGSYGLTGSLNATSFTGSLLGTSSYAAQALSASYTTNTLSASFASTASYLNPLNQNIIVTGSVRISQNLTASRAYFSSSNGTANGPTLIVYGSGSSQPVFTVQGSQGELFSITDSLSGSLYSVNDISGLPILEVFSDNTILMGNYQDPMLITTTKLVTTASGAFTLYSLPTASYDTAFFEYSIKSGSNARAGTIMAIQLGTSVNFTETTTTDFGSTTGFGLTVQVSSGNMILTGSATTSGWTIKTIVRGI